MNNTLDALQDFATSGYTIDVVFHSKDIFPISLKAGDDNLTLLDKEEHIICTITATKTEGKGSIVLHVKEEREEVPADSIDLQDLITKFRSLK